MELLSANFFVSPRYSHYYYGDYYDDAYIQIGIFAWFDHDRIPDYYDPIYAYDRSRRGQLAVSWETQERHDYDDRRAHIELRPARTFREMETRVAQAPAPQRRSLAVVQPLSVVVDNSTTNITNIQMPSARGTASPAVARSVAPLKFEKVSPAAQTKIATQAADVKKMGNDRKGWEATAANPKAIQAPSIPITPTAAPGASRGRGAAAPADRTPPAAAVQIPPPPAVQPAPRGGVTAPPAGRGPVVIPPAAVKEPVVIPPPDRNPPAAAIPNPPTPAAPSAAHNEPAAPPRKAAPPPREVPVAQPEKVKLPTPPAVSDAKPAPAADKGPPPKPVNEGRGPSDSKAPSRKDDTPTPSDRASPGGRGGGSDRGN